MPQKSNTRRADGLICVRVCLGSDAGGRYKYKYCYGHTQKEAEQKADVVRASLRKGIDYKSRDQYSAVIDMWLMLKKSEVSQDQYNLLKSRCELIRAKFGSESVRNLKAFDFQFFINDLAERNPMTGKPSAQNTLKSYCQILAAVGRAAVENRIIEFNAADYLKIPRDTPERKRRSLNQEERNRVMTFEHRAQPAAVLMMLSGLRRGEATALTWNDIDFNKSTIKVKRSYNFKQKAFKPPKNGKPRTIYIPQKLVAFLEGLPRKSEYVLTSAKGKMLSATAWKRMFESYMCDMNVTFGGCNNNKFDPHGTPMLIQTFTPHDLRHTFATILYESGIDVLVAKEQLGHSDVKTTLAIYTHLSNEHQERSVEKLDNYLMGVN